MRKAIPKDWVDAYFDFGIDRDNRRVFLLGGVEEDVISYAIKSIYYLDAQVPQKAIEDDDLEKYRIELYIGSFGGSEYEMFGLYDVLNSTSCPITTVAIGKCMSAAPLLVAAGDPGHRYAMPNCQFMVHQSWDEWAASRTDEQKRLLRHYDEMSSTWYSLMAKHTNQTASQWKKMCEKVGDTYFNADKAVEYGIVDQLWNEKEG